MKKSRPAGDDPRRRLGRLPAGLAAPEVFGLRWGWVTSRRLRRVRILHEEPRAARRAAGRQARDLRAAAPRRKLVVGGTTQIADGLPPRRAAIGDEGGGTRALEAGYRAGTGATSPDRGAEHVDAGVPEKIAMEITGHLTMSTSGYHIVAQADRLRR